MNYPPLCASGHSASSKGCRYTFLLPAFKRRFFRESLESILSQTYTDFKVIVSDDNSPEDIRSIVESFNDKRVSFRRNTANIGGRSLVEHWNLLVGLCDTEWLILASDDDVYDSRFLESIDAMTHRYPQVDVVRTRARKIDEVGDCFCESQPTYEYQSQADFVLSLYGEGQIQCIANHAFRTSELKKVGGFVDYPLAWFSDVMTAHLMAGKGIATVDEMLFSFRCSGINITTQSDTPVTKRQKLLASFAFLDDELALIQTLPTDTKILRVKHELWMKRITGIFYNSLVFSSDALSFCELRLYVKKYGWLLNGGYDRLRCLCVWLKGKLR